MTCVIFLTVKMAITCTAPPLMDLLKITTKDELNSLLDLALRNLMLESSLSPLVLYQIVKLAAVRINGMIEKLEKKSESPPSQKSKAKRQSQEQLRESVYCLFQKILNQRTSLFFNRHIDQIILCSLYGVAKVCTLFSNNSSEISKSS